MKSTLYYLIGQPNTLKQGVISAVRASQSLGSPIIIPEIYTTDPKVAAGNNYSYIDKRNFILRKSMGFYSLSWEKNSMSYGVNGDVNQRLNSGYDVILNGSFDNIFEAKKSFPDLSTVLIRNFFSCSDQSDLIAEDDDVRLERMFSNRGAVYSYILTVMSAHGMHNALAMLNSLFAYNRRQLERVI